MTEPDKAIRDRSPSFPFISLKAAIARLEEFEAKFLRQEPTADRAYLAWGMSGDTSQSAQTLAALKYFGLIEYKGSGSKRLVAISEEGRKYLRAQQLSVKQEVLKRLALRPKWIAHFWSKWGTDKVPDEMRLDALVLEHKFNQNSAPKFLKVYDETIAFAGLSASDKATTVDSDNDDEEEEAAEVDPTEIAIRKPSAGATVPLQSGERELTTGLLAKDASFRLIVTGRVGPKEIDILIRKLALDKEILADPEIDSTN